MAEVRLQALFFIPISWVLKGLSTRNYHIPSAAQFHLEM